MSQQGRRWVVAIVWMAVGVMLIVRGLPYAGVVHWEGVTGLTGSSTWVALAIALAIGVGKGLTVLKSAAARAAAQIVAAGPKAPFWSVFTVRMLVLVGLMIAFGLAIRKLDYDPSIKAWLVGILYPGIGIGLIIGGWEATTVAPRPAKIAIKAKA